MRRHLRRIIRTRSTGLFANARARNELNLAEQIREIEGGNTYVVDIARLNDEEQKLVFGDVLRTVYELKAEDPENRVSKKPIPEKVIFFVDELNKYAPSGMRGSPILEQVLDIAERGRSLGCCSVLRAAIHVGCASARYRQLRHEDSRPRWFERNFYAGLSFP